MKHLPIFLATAFLSFAVSAPAIEITDFRQTPFLANQGGGHENLVKLQTRNPDQAINATITIATPQSTITTSTLVASGDATVHIMIAAVTSPTTASVSVSHASGPPITRAFPLNPVKQWKIFAVPSTHTDIGYTEGRADVMKRHNNSLDQALDYIAKDPDGKWNLEVSWELQNYMNLKSTTETENMLDVMRANRMGLHAGYLNMLTALMSDEAMNRYCFYTAELGRKFGLKTETLILTDVPSATWSVPSTLAASGVKYFAEGCNPDRGPMVRNVGIHNPFYWLGPDGAKVLTVLSTAYAQSAWLAEIDNYTNFQEHLNLVVQPYMRDDYPSDAIYQYGAFLDNRPFNPAYGRFLKQHADQWEWPKIQIATSDEFFHYLEAQCGDKLKTLSGDFGAFWEDGAGSTALETSMHLESQRRLVAAETLFSLADMATKSANYPIERMTQAWEDVLFYIEHTWGAAESITQPDSPMAIQQWSEKSEFAHRPFAETDILLKEAVKQYAALAKTKSGDLTIVNSLGFVRDGLVPLGEFADTNVRVSDPSGEHIPTQMKDGITHAFVTGAPAFGHSVFKVEPTADVVSSSASLSLENKYYNITADQSKGITSIIDRETGKELLSFDGPYGFGQVVYALGGEGTRMVFEHLPDSPKFILQPPLDGIVAPTPVIGEVFVYPANIKSVEPGASGPLFSEINMRSTAPSLPDILTTVRLHHHEKRIEVNVDITAKKEERRKEGVYVAFPFAMPDPAFRFGMTNAIANPAKDFFRGGCHEWYCVQDFVTLRAAAGGPEILWSSADAPLITLSELNKGTWKQQPELTTSTIFSYAMNNYWHTNYKAAQGGDFRFRYHFTSGAARVSNSECLRFARSANTPLIAVTGGTVNAAAALLPAIEVSDKTIIANTIRKAINGKGYIIRLRNPEDKATSARITRDGKPLEYRQVDLVENDLNPAAKMSQEAVNLKPYQSVTLYVPNAQ